MRSTGSEGLVDLAETQHTRRDWLDVFELVERLLGAAFFLAVGFFGWSETESLAVWERLLAEWIPLVVGGTFLVLAAQSFLTLFRR